MPKTEMAVTCKEIGAEDTAVIVESWQRRPRLSVLSYYGEGSGFTEYNEVTISSDSTAMVLTARTEVAFFPFGRNALPYWKNFIGQRSFRHVSRLCHCSGRLIFAV